MLDRFVTVNPVTNNVLREYGRDNIEESQRYLENSKKVFNRWKNSSLEQRKILLERIASLLIKNIEKYARLITDEMGKPITQARGEIKKCAWVCTYYAQNAANFLEDTLIHLPKGKNYISYQPLGTILQIMPWNFPFWQVFRCTAPALMAGNVTLLKHAPNVLGCAMAIQELIEEAGVPKAVFQVLKVGVEEVPSLLANPIIKGLALTGSLAAGAAVGALAGQNIKPLVLELGGSDAFIVLADANLEAAAAAAVRSRMFNSGQTCIAAKRFIVQKKVAATFKSLVKQNIAALSVGDPLDPSTIISAMARLDLAQTLQKQVDQSIKMGAVSEIGGGHQLGSNYFYPMLLSNIQKGTPAYEEELFGPVVAFFEVENIAEAIALANDTIFGLGASVWSANEELAQTVALQLEVGAVAINQMLSSDPRIPFGGVKQSGLGRELGKAGIMEFVNQKSIMIAP